jgi:hypothetical protein
MEPNRGASEVTLRDACDWSRAFRLDLAFGGELAEVPPPPKASINCTLLIICCKRSMTSVSRFTSKIHLRREAIK